VEYAASITNREETLLTFKNGTLRAEMLSMSPQLQNDRQSFIISPELYNTYLGMWAVVLETDGQEPGEIGFAGACQLSIVIAASNGAWSELDLPDLTQGY
jgi:hypothetical protein